MGRRSSTASIAGIALAGYEGCFNVESPWTVAFSVGYIFIRSEIFLGKRKHLANWISTTLGIRAMNISSYGSTVPHPKVCRLQWCQLMFGATGGSGAMLRPSYSFNDHPIGIQTAKARTANHEHQEDFTHTPKHPSTPQSRPETRLNSQLNL